MNIWTYKFAAEFQEEQQEEFFDNGNDPVADEGMVEDESGALFWGSRGSGILFVRKHPKLGSQLLLVLRSPAVLEPNTWGISGGAVPIDESDLFASAVRETLEELGSLPREYKQIGQYTWQQPGGSFTYTTFIVQVIGNWTPTHFNWEVDDARWVSLTDAVGFDLHFGLSDLLNELGPTIYKGASKKLAQRTKDQILEEYHQVYNASNARYREIVSQIPHTAKTYYESILEDYERREQSKIAWQPMLAWMQSVLGEVQATGDAKFAESFQEEMQNVQNRLSASEPRPEQSEYENYFDEEVLEWYLDGDPNVYEHIIPLLEKNNISWEEYTFPTGKKVITIEVAKPTKEYLAYNRWSKGEFWVVEQDDSGIKYWKEPEEWVSFAAEHEYDYYPETDFSKEFWQDVGPGSVLYHATPDENVPSIQKHGLEARDDTRGLSNKDMGPAVFTITGENSDNIEGALESYGAAVFEIDLAAMKADGYMPDVAQETPISEGELKRSLAAAIDWDDYSPDEESDYMPDTVAIYGDIPPKYLRLHS